MSFTFIIEPEEAKIFTVVTKHPSATKPSFSFNMSPSIGLMNVISFSKELKEVSPLVIMPVPATLEILIKFLRFVFISLSNQFSMHHGLRKIFRLYIQLRIAHSNARKASAAKKGPNWPKDSAIPLVNTSAIADSLITVLDR